MPTCKDCLGKKQHSVLAHITSRWDLWGKDYTFTRYTMQDCSRCKGTGFEYPPMPKIIPISPDVCDEDEDIKEWCQYLLFVILPIVITGLILLVIFLSLC